MQKEILDWLKHDRKFNTGVLLYFRYGRNRSYINMFNLQGETKQNQETLLEEFRQMLGKSIVEFNKLIKQPVRQKKIDNRQEIKEIIQANNSPEAIEIRQKVKNEQKLRDEFPFLNSPDCPNELKILVADKITAFRAYKESHKELFTTGTSNEKFTAVKNTVENYIMNRKIYDELNYYKQHNKLLGEHPVFARVKMIDELQETNTVGLTRLKDNLKKYIRRNKENIDKKDKPHLNKKRLDAISEFEWELAEVEKILATRK